MTPFADLIDFTEGLWDSYVPGYEDARNDRHHALTTLFHEYHLNVFAFCSSRASGRLQSESFL